MGRAGKAARAGRAGGKCCIYECGLSEIGYSFGENN